MRSGSRQKRVWLLFVVGIVLPSLLLGYLAFRGIQNDQALVEKQRTDDQRRAADLVATALDDRIEVTERDFLALGPGRRDSSRQTLVPGLERFIIEHPLVETIFLCQNQDTIRFPTERLIFLPPGATAQAGGTRAAASGAAATAERLEFAEQNYPAALASYGQARDRATDLQTRAELTTAMARVQKKALRYADAIVSYLRIAEEFGQVRSAGGIPLGLAARMELASLYSATDDPSHALQVSIDLYESLVKGAWALEEAQYAYYAQAVSDLADSVLPRARPDSPRRLQEQRFAALKEEAERQRKRAARLLPFSTGAARGIRARLSASTSASAGASERSVLELGGHSYLVSVRSPEAVEGREAAEIWGLLLDGDALEEVLHELLTRHASSEGTAWVVRGPGEQILMASEEAPFGAFTVRAGFDRDFPNWSIEFYQRGPRRMTTLLGSGRGIYFYMFVLIAGILVFGLILTIRTVSHELELAKMKSDFVSTVSHEFKSPLTSIQQVAEMLQAGRVPSEDRRQQYYDLLLEQSQRLCLLTDNILNLARIEEGRKQFVFETLDVAALLRELLPGVQDRVRHEGFTIELRLEEPLPEVRADGEALAQAVTNLLDNAVKYSGQARQVIVRASVEDRYLVISVRDFGIGIKKDEAGRVFDRFYRGGDELTRSVKGSGLGLTLVKEIVEAHHGTVHVESEPGQGSTFSVRLPRASPESRIPTPDS